jgi:hypothetical protein
MANLHDDVSSVNHRGDAWEPSENGTPKNHGYRFAPIDSLTFASKNLKPNWLIRRILVENLPCIVGGPRKSLKTSILADLIISAASATPFLNKFAVPRPIRCAFISGESGDFTIQETAKRICYAKGLDLASLPVWWDFRLPQFANSTHLASLTKGLREREIELCAIDPVYLSLMSGAAAARLNSADIFDMGPLLLSAGRACLDAGATPILAHHTKKGTAASLEPLELEDLSGAGVAEFARTWLLLSRLERYEPGTGVHKLWMVVGGSVGYGSLSAVEINEGNLADDFTGRYWEVQVLPAGTAKENIVDEKERRRTEQKERKDKAEDAKTLLALDEMQPKGRNQMNEPHYPCLSDLAAAAGLSKEAAKRSLYRLIRAGIVEEVTYTIHCGKNNKAQRKGVGYRRRKPTDGTERTKGTNLTLLTLSPVSELE